MQPMEFLSLAFLLALVLFLTGTSHLLITLLSLELLVLLLFLFLSLGSGASLFNSFTYLVVVVCEGALGLSLLITLVRSSGSDLVSRLDG